ncbi:MAG: hypothetical protein V1907_04675 [Candidatus Kerfeldbacteria bacterium]
MYPPCLTVIEGGNPDDQFSKTSIGSHLLEVPQLVHEHDSDYHIPEVDDLPVIAQDESRLNLFLLWILDALIALTVQFLFSVGAFRTRVAYPARLKPTGTDAPWTGRGW